MSYAKLGMAAIGAAAAYGLSRGRGRRAGERYEAAEWLEFFSGGEPTIEAERLRPIFTKRIEYLLDNKFNLPDDAEYPDLDQVAYLSYATIVGHGIGLWENREPWHESFGKVVEADQQASDMGHDLDMEFSLASEANEAVGEGSSARGRRATLKYKIFEGYDHYKGRPLYQVSGVDNEYVGEWHTRKKDAQDELKGLGRSARGRRAEAMTPKQWVEQTMTADHRSHKARWKGKSVSASVGEARALADARKTGKLTAYLSGNGKAVTGWLGNPYSSRIALFSTYRDNFGGERTPLRFVAPWDNNKIWSGYAMGRGMYGHFKRTKIKDLWS